MEIFHDAETLKALTDQIKELESKAKELQKLKSDLEQKMCQQMALEEVEKFTHSGTTFYLSQRIYASPGENKEELYTALKNNGYGDLIKETVNANSLNSCIRELIEEYKGTLPEWLNDKVTTFTKNSIGMRRG